MKILHYILIISLILIDQLSKILLINFFQDSQSYQLSVFPFLNLVYVWNKGISFGMFSTLENSNYLFMFASTCISIVLLYFLATTKNKIEKISYSLIVAGAAGNILDRIIHGAVFDFIDFHIYQHHWPAFNVADSLVFIGVLLLMLNLFFNKK